MAWTLLYDGRAVTFSIPLFFVVWLLFQYPFKRIVRPPPRKTDRLDQVSNTTNERSTISPTSPFTRRQSVGDRAESATHGQGQSFFFNKTTAELRLIIYKHVLADGGHEIGRNMHLTQSPSRLVAFRCRVDAQPWPSQNYKVFPEVPDCCYMTRRDHYHGHHYIQNRHPDPSLLGLLCACRRTYREAINILYSQNKFRLRGSKTLVDWVCIMPAHRLGAIRYLYLDISMRTTPLKYLGFRYTFNYSTWFWPEACQVLSSHLTQLQHLVINLHVTVAHHMRPELDRHEDALALILEPLQKVQSGLFVVQLEVPEMPWLDSTYLRERLGKTPYTFIYRSSRDSRIADGTFDT